jgi:chaperonin GroES
MPEIDPKSPVVTNIYKVNIAEDLDKEELVRIGRKVFDEYDVDLTSREEWERRNEDAMELASQIYEEKRYQGEIVANVKYPTISIASIQFAARAYPNIVQGRDVVKCARIGQDLEGQKQLRADRISQHMSYQLLEQMSFEEELDQLLITLPVVGCAFKKTYWSPVDKKPVSELVLAEDLVINYYAKNLLNAPRVTHVIELFPNEYVERVRAGIYLDIELGEPHIDADSGWDSYSDDDAPHIFLEQHRWLDLDEDGYAEPYIVVIHRDTQQVVRIVARYGLDSIVWSEDGDIQRIIPTQYFTRYIFMPAFDGGVYGQGFGSLLGPINRTINTSINQLLDAGTLSNRQSGFFGKGVNVGRDRSLRVRPGEWKYVNNTGDDLRKGIVPLPVKEPSATLMSLLQVMISAGQELSSTADILTGQKPQRNEPATTTLARIEQGLKVFSAIYKRIYRSLRQEFKKIRRLNMLYLSDEQYNRILDWPEPANAKMDYQDADLDIVPVSSEADLTDVQRVTKAQALLEMTGRGLNDQEIYRRYFEALGVENIQAILEAPPAPPDPEMELKKQEAATKQQKVDQEQVLIEQKALKERATAIKALADAEAQELGSQLAEYEQLVEEMQMVIDQQNKILNQGMSNVEGQIQQGGYPQLEESPDYGGIVPEYQ